MSSRPNQIVSAAAAARLLGLRRKDMQKLIQSGRLPTFEGGVRTEDLEACFPNYAAKSDAILEQCDRIKEAAMSRLPAQSEVGSSTVECLMREVEQRRREVIRLQTELQATASLAERRGDIIKQLRAKMAEMQEGCDRREATILATLSNWLVSQSAERKR